VKIAVKMTWADRIRAEAWQEGMEQGLEKGLEQGIEQGLETGLERGRAQGEEQGARRILLRLLGLKFGPLPRAVRSRVEAIDSVETLNGLADRVLAARSLGDLGLV
jgi:flagellar biosynthesis/type III secretory pathway protein FliH